MAYDVLWSAEAEETYSKVIFYLQENWTEREVKNFVERVESLIGNITNHPYLFNPSNSKQTVKRLLANRILFFITCEIIKSYCFPFGIIASTQKRINIKAT